MVNSYAKFSPIDLLPRYVNGRECTVPWAVNSTCAASKGLIGGLFTSIACTTCAAGSPRINQ
jgi:hypothetical protein